MGKAAKPKTSQNVSLDPDVLIEFHKYAERKGIKLSTWINAQMKQFIEDERLLEEIKSKRSKGGILND